MVFGPVSEGVVSGTTQRVEFGVCSLFKYLWFVSTSRFIAQKGVEQIVPGPDE